MDDAITSYAIFGSGETELGTALSLLTDLLGLTVKGRDPAYSVFYCPEQVPHRLQLKRILDRLEVPKYLGAGGAVPVDDLIEALLARREAGEDVALIALLPDNPTEEEAALRLRAHESGIKVMDLANALDDYPMPDDAGPEEPSQDEAPPADVPEPGSLAALGADVLDALLAFARQAFREQAAEFFRTPAPASTPAGSPASPRAGGGDVVDGAEEVPDADVPFKGGTRVTATKFRSEPGPAPGAIETVGYFKSATGGYRIAANASGKPYKMRPGEQLVQLTLEDQNKFVREGKITDPKDAK